MNYLPSEVFMLANEPVVVCRGGILRFANIAAVRLLGDGCVGQNIRKLFGAEIAEAQTKTYIANVPIKGKNHTLRISKQENETVIYITETEFAADIVNDAFLYSARGELMNINIALKLLKEGLNESATTQEVQNLSSIARSYYVLLRLIKNIAILNGINTGTLAFLPCTFDISAMCADMAEILKELRKDVELKLNLGGEQLLYADSHLIKLLIYNLLSNCLLHAKGLSHISMSLLNYKDNIVLSISDDGCGISPKELGTVFERYRYNFSLQNISGGAGLGLSVVRGIAAKHGGTLMLESRENMGTTVRVSFKKTLPPMSTMQEPQVAYDNLREKMIVNLVDVLPQELFCETYLE